MSKRICFRFEGFVREGDFYVPEFETNNTFRIKLLNGYARVYITMASNDTITVEGEIFDLIVSQNNTIRDAILWVDDNYELILHHYVEDAIRCSETSFFAFTHNNVEYSTSYFGNCCKECSNNFLLFTLKGMFGQSVETRYIVKDDVEPIWHDISRNGVRLIIDDGFIHINTGNYHINIPGDVCRLLLGIDPEVVFDIILNTECFRDTQLGRIHTINECQCESCFSEEMVGRVEAVLARMT
jgi:hypothetical protein